MTELNLQKKVRYKHRRNNTVRISATTVEDDKNHGGKVVGGLDVHTASVSHPTDFLSFSERATQLTLGTPGSHLSQMVTASQCNEPGGTRISCVALLPKRST